MAISPALSLKQGGQALCLNNPTTDEFQLALPSQFKVRATKLARKIIPRKLGATNKQARWKYSPFM